jgi:aryl-alcohol dehydrogenase-like predicted oxidoreductase
MKALERSLESLQATRVDLYQVTKPGPLYWGGEKAIFEALGQAKRLRLLDHVGLVGYNTEEELRRAKDTAKQFGVDVKSNSFELSLANPSAALFDGTIEACKKMGIVPFANRPLAGGLASGAYTMMDPSGGRSRKPRYTFPDLEPLYPVHKALREMATKYTEKLGKRVGTAQVSINWVRAKGAIPLVGVKNANQARDMVEATKWDLDEADVKTLDEVAMDTFKKRRKINELIAKARK